LQGRPLSGAARLALSGQGALLGGTFDAEVAGSDRPTFRWASRASTALVRGTTRLTVEATRDLDGIDLSVFRLGSPVARITAEGAIRSAGTRLNLSAALDDGTLLLPGLDGRHSLSVLAEGDGEVWSIRSSLTGQTLSGAITGELDDSDPVPAFDGVMQLDTSDLSPLAGLAGIPALGGGLALRFEGAARADLSRFDVVLTAEENGLTIGRPDLDAVLAQGLALRLDAAREDGGPVTLRVLSVDSPAFAATLDGTVSGLPPDLTALDADVLDTAAFDGQLALAAPDLSPLGPLAGIPALSGSLEARAEGAFALNLSRFDLRLEAQEQGLTLGRPDLDPLLSGGLTLALDAQRAAGGPVTLEAFEAVTPTVTVAASGTLSGLPDALVPPPPGLGETAGFDGRIALTASDLSPVGPLAGLPGLGGALDATLQGRVAADLEELDLLLSGNGRNFRTGIPAADAYLAGSTALTVEALREDGRLELRNARFTAPGLSAAVDGTLTDDGGSLAATLTLDDLGRIVEGFSGPANARIEASTSGGGPWSVNAIAQGPGGTALRSDGTVARGFDRVDLGITGEVPLGLANPFIQPRSIGGRATLDLRLSGVPALSALSGRITTEDARLVAPTLGVVLERVGATVDLGGGRAQLDITAAVQDGGTVSLSGPLTLTPPFSGDLRLTLAGARLRDPALFETSVSGALSVAGPLAGGATITGALSLGETELRIPAGVTGGTAPIPDIIHVGESAAVRQTLRRAGIVNGNGNGSGAGGPAYGLDIRIDAFNRIFVRGRGLDAELGGSLRIGGTTANIIPAGQFDLVRGRLDILGRRLVLDQGSITLQGDFDPFLRLSASSENDGILVSVILEGTLSDPDVRFESVPELPEDEVVARLLFGRGLDTISAFQAAQLAASVATLTGGGNGLLGNLREGFGLDDLDIATDAAGQTQLTLGTYLTEELYTDVVISEGRTEIEINLDLTPSITLRGATADDGTSSIGIRFERDY
jgi:translocation and assembly module TamB